MTDSNEPKTPEKPVIIHCAMCTLRDIHARCVNALIALVAQRKIHSFSLAESTYLPSARNIGANAAYQACPEFTHLLMIDSDIAGYRGDHLDRLVQLDKPIVSMAMRGRRDDTRSVKFVPVDVQQPMQIGDVVECYHTSFSFILIKREVLDATRITQYAPDGTPTSAWFYLDRRVKPADWPGKKQAFIDSIDKSRPIEDIAADAMDAGRDAIDGRPLTGEDVFFCWRAREFGFNTYVWLHFVQHMASVPVPSDEQLGVPMVAGGMRSGDDGQKIPTNFNVMTQSLAD